LPFFTIWVESQAGQAGRGFDIEQQRELYPPILTFLGLPSIRCSTVPPHPALSANGEGFKICPSPSTERGWG
ncbi:hypothetical protein, partial [Trichocoleus sp. DQ-U1]|uniref:hypothetical protein n=1 Tax=Trichocoleus sp. DQ-U1 TaxID=2933926 RepID=UPI003298AF31